MLSGSDQFVTDKLQGRNFGIDASYATPIAASPNMLVYGPDGYRFTDYMRIGIPLTIIVTVTGVAAVVLTYPLVRL